ncbi:MAG: phenylalanine--tRNA ligase subunit alpha [bacterium]
MKNVGEKIQADFISEIAGCGSQEELNSLRIKYLGKKGIVTGITRSLSDIPQEKRSQAGREANQLKKTIAGSIRNRQQELKEAGSRLRQEAERIDITLPGDRPPTGHLHPITQITEEINEIFISLGFSIAQGPEVETDYYNFEALNFPPNHPAKDMHDTFHVDENHVLRTHTSPVQIRVMETCPPPVKVIAPGKVYRCDADITHSPMFHQVEGLYVDEGVSFADLKGTLEQFVHRMFGKDLAVRFRPSFFPFTEPSAEIDMECVMCRGKGCRICSHTGWLEILGAGMVDPNVFQAVGYDCERYTGFAFGMGVERIAMLKYRIDDIRLFFENDIRFLQQF